MLGAEAKAVKICHSPWNSTTKNRSEKFFGVQFLHAESNWSLYLRHHLTIGNFNEKTLDDFLFLHSLPNRFVFFLFLFIFFSEELGCDATLPILMFHYLHYYFCLLLSGIFYHSDEKEMCCAVKINQPLRQPDINVVYKLHSEEWNVKECVHRSAV